MNIRKISSAACLLDCDRHTAFQKLSGVKSPSDFIELSTDHSRKQFETLTEQTKELAALAQKVTLATVEPLKTGATKVFGQPT